MPSVRTPVSQVRRGLTASSTSPRAHRAGPPIPSRWSLRDVEQPALAEPRRHDARAGSHGHGRHAPRRLASHAREPAPVCLPGSQERAAVIDAALRRPRDDDPSPEQRRSLRDVEQPALAEPGRLDVRARGDAHGRHAPRRVPPRVREPASAGGRGVDAQELPRRVYRLELGPQRLGESALGLDPVARGARRSSTRDGIARGALSRTSTRTRRSDGARPPGTATPSARWPCRNRSAP